MIGMPQCAAQLTLERETVHARQAYIEQQAGRLGGGIRLQERFRRREALDAKSNGSSRLSSEFLRASSSSTIAMSGTLGMNVSPVVRGSAGQSSHAPERNRPTPFPVLVRT